MPIGWPTFIFGIEYNIEIYFNIDKKSYNCQYTEAIVAGGIILNVGLSSFSFIRDWETFELYFYAGAQIRGQLEGKISGTLYLQKQSRTNNNIIGGEFCIFTKGKLALGIGIMGEARAGWIGFELGAELELNAILDFNACYRCKKQTCNLITEFALLSGNIELHVSGFLNSFSFNLLTFNKNLF